MRRLAIASVSFIAAFFGTALSIGDAMAANVPDATSVEAGVAATPKKLNVKKTAAKRAKAKSAAERKAAEKKSVAKLGSGGCQSRTTSAARTKADGDDCNFKSADDISSFALRRRS